MSGVLTFEMQIVNKLEHYYTLIGTHESNLYLECLTKSDHCFA